MRLLVLLFLPLFVGCASKPVPVTVKFPDVPATLFESCPELKKLSDDAKLSDIAKSVVENYTLYHECYLKTEAWKQWYTIHKNSFEALR